MKRSFYTIVSTWMSRLFRQPATLEHEFGVFSLFSEERD